MRLEDLNINNVSMLSEQELRNFRERANQLYRSTRNWASNIRKRMVGVTQPMDGDKLLEVFYLINREMGDRGLEKKENELDRKVFRKRVRGVDVSDMPIILVKEAVVSLAGPFVTGPRQAKTVSAYVDADEFGNEEFAVALEKRVMELLLRQTGKPVVVHRTGKGFSAPIIPVFDLVLLPREETVEEQDVEALTKRLGDAENTPGSPLTGDQAKDGLLDRSADDSPPAASLASPVVVYADISKPFPSEHAARQLDPKQFDDFARKNDHFGPGIHAIFGIKAGKSKIQSIRFSASKFTPAQAKAWLKDHDFKTTLEVATGTKKSKTSFIKNTEQRVVGGIVYSTGSPAETDSQGDYVDDGQEIFEAMKSWMISGHLMKFMHEGKGVNTPLVECFYAESDTKKDGETIPAGSWYISNYIPVEYEELWEAIKNGDITGYSMGGKSKAQEVVEEE